MADDLDTQVKHEIDRRKVQKLVNDGIITQSQLDDAEIVDMESEQ